MGNQTIGNWWAKSALRRYRVPIVLSIAVHVVLFVSLSLWWQPIGASIASQDDATPEQPNASSPSTTDSGGKPQAGFGVAELDIDVPSDQIRSSVESQVDQVNAISDPQKLKTLDKKLSRLEEVSDQESVDQVADAVAESMGINQSQYADKPVNTEGSFDHSTAQIKTVTRNKNDSGDWSYVATMVDAQGHQLETPLSQTEGASVYETFEKMKQYPMAESLYQKIIMPMLQKMIESESAR